MTDKMLNIRLLTAVRFYPSTPKMNYNNYINLICQVIEDPVEIIDNERELKGFYNMDEVIKLVGYFKSEKSPRRLKTET